MAEPKDVAESIQDILVRSRRNELVKKVGHEGRRYLPPEDPGAFLLPDSKLEPAERRWQKVFVALPWVVFACMVAAPFVLVRTNLPWLQERARGHQIPAEHAVAAADRVPAFEVVGFAQMPDVLDRPYPTVLLLFDSATFMSKLFLPALRDLEAALRSAGLSVSVAALDLGAPPGPPDVFLWEYPRATTPHLQLVVPRGLDGEAGVIDYDGSWSASGIAEAARQLVGPYAPRVPPEELGRLDEKIQSLHDALFELLFVEDASLDVPRPPRRSWWRRAFTRERPVEPRGAADGVASLAEMERQLDLVGGLDASLASCQGLAGGRHAAPPA